MNPQEIQVREKEEIHEPEEKTEVGRYYVPHTDIHESTDALVVTMDMPGVRKENVNIELEKNLLTVTGTIDFSNYEALKPIYTEYNVGNFTRSFSLNNEIDKNGISAKMLDGVLKLQLPKVKEATAKKIEVR